MEASPEWDKKSCESTASSQVPPGKDVESLDHLSRDKTASPPEGPERREDITDDDDDDDDDDEKEERNSLDAAKGAKTDGESKEEEKKPYRVNREEMEEKLKRAKELARSEIRLSQWDRYGFAKLDLDKELAPFGDDLMRRHCDQMTAEEFVRDFEQPCRPCVIQGLLKNWPAYQTWSICEIASRYPEARLKCGEDDDGYKVRLALGHFGEYARTQKDDSPLYVFDADFGDDGKVTQPLLQDFSVPHYFNEDLFKMCGEDKRPPYRWLLLGPRRSGSSIHIDPLATSAWNSVIRGRKLWALFPPGTPKSIVKPPGWMERKDREAVDWFLFHLPKIRETAPSHMKPITCVTYPGDTIYVPGNWWHTVLNLDDTVAVTQNFCSTTCFPAVWAETVTGRTKLSRRWLRRLKEQRPDLYAVAQNVAGTGNGLVTAEEHIEQLLADRKAKKERKKANKRHRKELKDSERSGRSRA